MCRRRWELREPSAEDGLNGVAALGVAKTLIVYFGTIEETSCPIKRWFDCLRLLSVLMRLEHNQALLPALVLTPLLQHISTVIALQRREWSDGHFSHFSLLWTVTCPGPQFYIPFPQFHREQPYRSQQKMNKNRESETVFAVVCNKRSSLSQETCRGVRWMCLVCSETVGSWSLMELLWGSWW